MTTVWHSLYGHRELVGVLVAKQLKLRYRGTVLGFFWTLLNPLLLMLVYTLVFSVYLRLDIEKYPAFLFAGLLPWIWFSSSLQQGVTCILDGAGLVSRARFPAELLPVATLTANTVNFVLTLPLLLIFLYAFRVKVGAALALLPLLIAIEYILALSLVLMLSALNVFFRDLQHIILHVLVLLQFLTPIFYPPTLIPPSLRAWAFVNPLAVLVTAFQDVLFFNRFPQGLPLLWLAALSGGLLVAAGRMFLRYKQTFAEAL